MSNLSTSKTRLEGKSCLKMSFEGCALLITVRIFFKTLINEDKTSLRWSNSSNFSAATARGFIAAKCWIYARENRRDNTPRPCQKREGCIFSRDTGRQ